MEYNLSYYKKYFKYKTKYIQLQQTLNGGNPFLGVKYLGQGAENIAYDIGNNKILRIRKNCESLGNEIVMLNFIKDKKPKYFVVIYDIGKCTDLITKFTPDDKDEDKIKKITEICNTFVILASSRNDERNNISGDLCEYSYVIMENAKGINIIQYIINYLKKNIAEIDTKIIDITNKDNIILLNDLVIYILQIFENISIGIKDAQQKIPNFYHGDLNYRNVYINDSNLEPTIFDFGASNQNIGTNKSIDILNYIRDTNNNISDFVNKENQFVKNNVKNIVNYILDKYSFTNDYYKIRISSQKYKILDIKPNFNLELDDLIKRLKDNQCSILKELLSLSL